MKIARCAAEARMPSVRGAPKGVCDRDTAPAAADRPVRAPASACIKESAASNMTPRYTTLMSKTVRECYRIVSRTGTGSPLRSSGIVISNCVTSV